MCSALSFSGYRSRHEAIPFLGKLTQVMQKL